VTLEDVRAAAIDRALAGDDAASALETVVERQRRREKGA